MGLVLLTISGPDKREDLSAPDDTPIEQLLPTFLELVGPAQLNGAGAGWSVGVPGRAALPSDQTLDDCAIVDGAILDLRPPGGPAPAVAEEPMERPLRSPGPGTPLERSGRLLPERLGLGRRLQLAAQATFARGAEDEQPPAAAYTESLTSPNAVTMPRPTTPMERAVQSWKETEYVRRLDRAIAEPRLRRCVTIAVMSPKGGVGKTTITALLGSLLAHVRRDRTVAIDTNPDYGSLGRTLTPEHRTFVDDLLDILDSSDPTATQLDTHLGRGPDGLLVLPAPTDPGRMSRLDRTAYERVIERLQAKVGVLLLDCGTGLQEPAAQAALIAADQLVVVSDAEPSTATLVAEASQQLLKSGAPLELVVNKLPPRGARLDVEGLGRLIPEADGMCVIEAAPSAAVRVAAGTFTWAEAAGAWEFSMRELAVSLVSRWSALGLTAREADVARSNE